MAQYLCGSKNAKVQKLNLHRLSGFGLLKGCRQADGVAVLDALLAAGLLLQKEVNKNRPTIELASEWMDVKNRASLLAAVQVPGPLRPRLKAIAAKSQLAHAKPNSAVEKPQAKVPSSNSPTQHAEVGDSLGSRLADDGKATRSKQLEGRTSDAVKRNSEATQSNRRRSLENERVSARASSTPPPSQLNLSSAKEAPRPDWQWTLKLFEQGLTWSEIMQIRQMEDEELSASLCSALRGGSQIQRAWIKAGSDGVLSVGQQRVVRELQRRAAAGIR
jgi:superfamily II DNA helicase RecQ